MRRGLAREAPVVLWALALALLVLGPALGYGFLLVRDMVWVPDLALRADALGLGSGLPRAVPPTPSWRCWTRSSPGCCCRSSCSCWPWPPAGSGRRGCWTP